MEILETSRRKIKIYDEVPAIASLHKRALPISFFRTRFQSRHFKVEKTYSHPIQLIVKVVYIFHLLYFLKELGTCPFNATRVATLSK